MFPEIPDWALLTTAAFLGFGVIPVAAFERWRRIVFSTLTFNLFQLRQLRRDLEAMELALDEMRTRLAAAPTEDAPSAPLDYIEAGAIVDRYIEPALRDMRDAVRLTVRKDFMDRFDNVTGAKLGEYEYNRVLLHQWMQSNAARFLVENRGKML